MSMNGATAKRLRCTNYVCDFYSAFDEALHGGGSNGVVLRRIDVSQPAALFSVPTFSASLKLALSCPREEEGSKRRGLRAIICDMGDMGHTALDIAGMVPMIGELADIANAGLYTLEGDWLNAGLSAAAAIPMYGNIFAVGKLGRLHEAVDDMRDEVNDIASAVKHSHAPVPAGVQMPHDTNALAVAVPALAVGVVIGAVGARRYWYKGLRTMARARRWARQRQLERAISETT